MTPKYDGPRIVRRCVDCGWISSPCKTPGTAKCALSRHSCDLHRDRQEKARRGAARMAAVDRTPKPCLHKEANHQHGTRACYVLDRCRCHPCSDARSAADRARTRAQAYGRYERYVSGDQARARVAELRAAGLGLKTIAQRSGVSHGSLWKLVYGGPNGVPSVRFLAENFRNLEAMSVEDLAAGAVVDQTGTTRRIQALVAVGWSGSKIAARLGMNPANFAPLMHGTRRVTVEKRDAVAALYDERWNAAPPQAEHRDKIAANRARRMAERLGWVPPLAWDDDTIDDPASRPDRGDGRRGKAADRIRDLLDVGETVEDVARHLGVQRETVLRALEREAAT